MASVRRLAAPVVLVGLAACGELFSSGARPATIAVLPDFSAVAAFATDADRLHIVLRRLDTGGPVTVADTIIPIDPATGEASIDLSVVLLAADQQFEVRLEAIRSADGMVLFTGVDTVTVSSGGEPTVATPTFTYVGPRGSRVAISPKDTVIPLGASMTFRATVYDAANAVVPVPVRFSLANPADSVILVVDRLSGVAASPGAVEGSVRVVARTADSLTDTASVLVGVQPNDVLVTPSFANLVPGGTLQLSGSVVDASGTPIVGGAVTWESRNPDVATVSASGLLTGIAAGVTRVVASGALDPSLKDSILVTVVAPGSVVASTAPDGRAFQDVAVGTIVTVDVLIDMRLTASELLGSYNATLTWNPSLLSFVDVQPGTFPAPQVNASGASAGQLRFAQADPNGASGSVVVARVRLQALANGVATPGLSISELSAAVTFTNLLEVVTVTNGAVTVR